MGVYQTNPLPTSVNTPHGCQLLHCQSSTWEATEDGPGLLAPAPTWKAGKKQVPNLSSGYNSYLGNESMISRPALPLLLSVYKNLFFHIKKKKVKTNLKKYQDLWLWAANGQHIILYVNNPCSMYVCFNCWPSVHLWKVHETGTSFPRELSDNARATATGLTPRSCPSGDWSLFLTRCLLEQARGIKRTRSQVSSTDINIHSDVSSNHWRRLLLGDLETRIEWNMTLLYFQIDCSKEGFVC